MNDLTLSLIIHVYKENSPYHANLLVEDGVGIVELYRLYRLKPWEVIRTIQSSWLLHPTNQQGKWQPTVRPPRLGGNQRIEQFELCSATHRPNPGLSKVELRQVECINGNIFLHLVRWI